MAYSEDGTLTLKVLAQDLASGKLGTFVGHMDKMAKQGGLMGSVFQGVGQNLGQMLNPVALVSKGIGMVTDLVGDANKAVSDWNESNSKAGVVFDTQAATIRRWAGTTADAFGISETAALEASGTLGNFLQAMGTAEPASAGMSRELVELAADLASFNNAAGGAEEVLVALQSGLAGETEPMRRFGVDISDAAVQAHLLADGVERVDGAFTQGQKVQARYALIMDKTTKAQGDFARTADEAANMQRRLDARSDDLLVTLGRFTAGPASAFNTFLLGIVDSIDGPDKAEGSLYALATAIRDVDAAIEETTLDAWAVKVGLAEAGIADLRMSLFGPTEGSSFPEDVLGWLDRLGPEAIAAAGRTAHEVATMGAAIHETGGDFTAFNKVFYDTRAAQVGYITGAGLMTESTRRIGVAALTAEERAARLEAGLELLADQGLREVAKEGRSAERALRKLLEGPDREKKALIDLQRQLRVVMGIKRRAASQGQVDAFTGAAAREDELRGLIKVAKAGRAHNRQQMQDFNEERGARGRQAADIGRTTVKQANMNRVIRTYASLVNVNTAKTNLWVDAIQGLPERITLRVSAPGMETVLGQVQRLATSAHSYNVNVNSNGRAGGGPVSAGNTYLVGERGPELLHMGHQSGHVTPNSRLRGGGNVINVNLAGATFLGTPAEAQHWARNVTPAIVREMRRLGIG